MIRPRIGARGAGALAALLIAAGLAAFGVVRGTWAVGGSDSSCYGLMAAALASGDLQPTSALATAAPWPDAALTLAPGGFVPSPVRPDAASPVCVPGLSLFMAPLAAVFGRDAIFWVIPIAGAVLVFSAFVLGHRLSGAMAGTTAALLTATSPIVLFQVGQPMNDVLTAALWLAALAVTRAPAAGVLIGLALLVRPNLAPLALVPAVWHWRALGPLALGAAPGVALLLWFNYALYGHPLSSGYGNASALFSAGHAAENLRQYASAAFRTQHVLPLLAVLAPFVFAGEARRLAHALLAGVAIVITIYLFYQPFPEWWYLRFLMPALVMLLVLASAVAVTLAARARMGGLIPIAALLLAIVGVRTAADLDVFDLPQLEGRYRATATLVRDRLPENAVLLTVWQSGSVRFHAGREAVLWDSLDPAWLDRAVEWLRARGLQPYFLFERREEPAFRERFRKHATLGALDWPPRFDVRRQVRIYDPADSGRYLSGEAYATEQIR